MKPKILIIRFSSIGDIVLTTPVIRCLKKQLNAEVHFLTKKTFASILADNPYIDKLHLLEDDLLPILQNLRQEKFDYVIDLHHNLRTFIVKRFLLKKSFSFNKLNVEKWLLVNFKINRLPAKHIVDRYLETVTSLGVQNDGEGLDYFIPAKDEVSLQTLPEAFQGGYVAWVIGAKQNTKKFPKEKIMETLSSLHEPIILLGGKEDEAMGEEIVNAMKDNSITIFNVCGKYNLNQSASLIKQANVVITNDTGLMHIAAAFKKKIISIWGNTIPEFGMTPYFGSQKSEMREQTKDEGQKTNNSQPFTTHLIFQTTHISCRPCSKIGFEKCPKGHFDCMLKIDTQAIVQATEQLLKS